MPRAHDRISTKVSWSREIRPLVERRCVSCHTRGGFAFPLTTYEDARPWAVAMKEMTLSGDMPPWGAAPGIGHFSNDRRLSRHELELLAAWVDGGAPRAVPNAVSVQSQDRPAASTEPAGTLVPLANAVIETGSERTASVTVQMPPGLSLTAWTFEPGAASVVERVDLELGTRWVGTWTPGEDTIRFPDDAGAPLGEAAHFAARIAYRTPADRVVDYSGIRIWTTKEPRSKTVREITVVRSWRPPTPVEVFGVRPNGPTEVEVAARFANGRVEPIGVFTSPSKAPHPLYRLVEPLAVPAGARIEVTAPVRLLYADGATRIAKPNVKRRPRR